MLYQMSLKNTGTSLSPSICYSPTQEGEHVRRDRWRSGAEGRAVGIAGWRSKVEISGYGLPVSSAFHGMLGQEKAMRGREVDLGAH